MSDEIGETAAVEVERDVYGNEVFLDDKGERVRHDVDASKPHTVTLLSPVAQGSVTITEITFNPVTGKIMKTMTAKKGHEMAATFAMAQKLTGVTSGVLDELQGPDLAEVLELTSHFLLPTRRARKTRTAT